MELLGCNARPAVAKYPETVLGHWPAGGQRISMGVIEQAESPGIAASGDRPSD
jgi:hypothetical protein